MRTEIFLHPLCLVRGLAQYWHLISICMLGKFILRLFFKCCFHFFVFPTEQIASALYCDLQASISIEQGIPLSLYAARKQSFHSLFFVSSYWQSSSLSLLGLAWIIVGWVNYAYGYYTGEPRMWKQAAMSFITLLAWGAFIWLDGLHHPCWPDGLITLAGLCTLPSSILVGLELAWAVIIQEPPLKNLGCLKLSFLLSDWLIFSYYFFFLNKNLSDISLISKKWGKKNGSGYWATQTFFP